MRQPRAWPPPGPGAALPRRARRPVGAERPLELGPCPLDDRSLERVCGILAAQCLRHAEQARGFVERAVQSRSPGEQHDAAGAGAVVLQLRVEREALAGRASRRSGLPARKSSSASMNCAAAMYGVSSSSRAVSQRLLEHFASARVVAALEGDEPEVVDRVGDEHGVAQPAPAARRPPRRARSPRRGRPGPSARRRAPSQPRTPRGHPRAARDLERAHGIRRGALEVVPAMRDEGEIRERERLLPPAAEFAVELARLLEQRAPPPPSRSARLPAAPPSRARRAHASRRARPRRAGGDGEPARASLTCACACQKRASADVMRSASSARPEETNQSSAARMLSSSCSRRSSHSACSRPASSLSAVVARSRKRSAWRRRISPRSRADSSREIACSRTVSSIDSRTSPSATSLRSRLQATSASRSGRSSRPDPAERARVGEPAAAGEDRQRLVQLALPLVQELP